MNVEAYSLAIRLKLAETVTASIVGLTGHFRKLNDHISVTQRSLDGVEAKLHRLKSMTFVGAGMVGAGAMTLGLFKQPLEEAQKFQTEVAAFSALGLGDKMTAQAQGFAKGMDIIGSSARDNMKLVREATTIMGDLAHAEEVAPFLAKMKFGIQSIMDGEHAEAFSNQLQSVVKVAELRGALINRATGHIDVKEFERVANEMNQAYVASGGLVKPSDYLAAIKTGGVSTKMMGDESFFFGLGHFMQESGGHRVGTSAMSMFQAMAMGRMTQQAAETWKKYGLLDPAAIHYGRTGHITKVDPMGVINSQDATQNPFGYINSVIVPRLEKQGLQGDRLNIALAELFHNRTASNLADQYKREELVANNYINRAHKAATVDTLYGIGAQTMRGKEIDLEAKWSSLMNELGTTVLPIAIKALDGFTAAIKGLTAAAGDHPAATKAVEYGVLGAAGLTLAGGLATLGRAGFGGLGLLGRGALAVGAGVAGIVTLPELVAAAAAVAIGAGAAYGTTKLINAITKSKEGDAAASDRRGTVVRPAAHAKQTVQVHTQLHVDGKKLATAVTHHQTRALERSETGISIHDGRMSLAPPGAGP